jgi:glycosyltransferase involved in cell wall biosynthesis
VCYETFGIILIESFRQGTPVLARRVGPLPEIVERSGGGLLFGDAGELTQAMRSIQQDAVLRARLATAARASFTEHWSEPVVVRQYLDLVERIARTKTPAVTGHDHA